MTAKPEPRRMTVAEYLAHERAATYKSDFIDGHLYPVHDPYGDGGPQAMAGASREHNRIKENLVVQLGSRFLGGPCTTFSSDQRVRVSASGRFTYPDVVIVCCPPQYADDDRDALVNPQVIIEVLSRSTEGYDRGLKFEEYRRQPSIREVVFVAQDRPVVERYVRQPDESWSLSTYTGVAGDLAFATVGVRVPRADIYRGVDFPNDARPDEPGPA